MVERHMLALFSTLRKYVLSGYLTAGVAPEIDLLTGEAKESGCQYLVKFICLQKKDSENLWDVVVRSPVTPSKNDKIGDATIIDVIVSVGKVSLVKTNAKP